jgi:hypothetical protein
LVRVQHRKLRKHFQSTGSFRKDPGKLDKTSESGNNQRTTDDWSSYDHFIVAISPHGIRDAFELSDSSLMKIEYFQRQFEGLKCPEQLRKLKIFFTNICRGYVTNYSNSFNNLLFVLSKLYKFLNFSAFDVPTDARSRSEEENEGKLKCWIRIIRNFRCLGHNTRKCSIQRSIVRYLFSSFSFSGSERRGQLQDTNSVYNDDTCQQTSA